MHCDGGGLYLQVTTGTDGALRRSWLYRFATTEVERDANKELGRERQMGLGSFPDTSLAEARQKAAEARKLREHRIDPITARDARRAAQELSSAKTQSFSQCCDQYVAAHRAAWGLRHTKVWVSETM
jgi:hypothetical protein